MQAITRNTAHMFCIRQYASFQDKYHLYLMFDLMMGGDLMDVLVAEAKVIRRRDSQGGWKRGCLAPKVSQLPHITCAQSGKLLWYDVTRWQEVPQGRLHSGHYYLTINENFILYAGSGLGAISN